MSDSTLSRFLKTARTRLLNDGAQPIAGASPGRRRFFQRAGGTAIAALGTGLLAANTAEAMEARAAHFGITPGTVVDAQGRPMASNGVNPYVGEIMLVGYNFATRGFALCQGQLQAISSNTALFSLLGTFYGGDGRTTFGLPDLQGRAAMGQGNGPGLTPRQMGQKVGTEEIYIQTPNLPAHHHGIGAVTGPGSSRSPVNGLLAGTPGENEFAPPPATAQMQPTGNTGGNIPIQKVTPSLVLNYQIALFGVYPSRS